MFIRTKKIILIIYSIVIMCAIVKVRETMAEENRVDACTSEVTQNVRCIGNIDAYSQKDGGNGCGTVYTVKAADITGDDVCDTAGGDAVECVSSSLYEQNASQMVERNLKAYKPKPAFKRMDGLIIRKRDGIKLSDRERGIMCRIVEAEAGGENISGKMLVANVLINRYLSRKFPDTMEKIVFAHSGRTYQFSPVGDGRYYSVKISRETKKAVKKALSGVDNSRGAVYFMSRKHAKKSSTAWFDNCLDYLFKYGCHEFFK